MSRTFTIIAHARSGSTLLCRKLALLSDGQVYLEIFHQNIRTIQNHLQDSAAAAFAHFQPLEGAALRDHLASHPIELLAFLSDQTPDTDQFFKLFPGHLKPPALRAVIGHSAGVILLQRNLLHSFISSRIARRIQKWTTVDTSAHKITFDADDFLTHLTQVTGFYTRARAIAARRGVPCADVSYELLADPDTGAAQLRAALGPLDITLRPEDRARDRARDQPDERRLRRQDNRPLATDKVDNPDDLRRFLDRLGLAAANDGRAALPVADFRAALERHQAP